MPKGKKARSGHNLGHSELERRENRHGSRASKPKRADASHYGGAVSMQDCSARRVYLNIRGPREHFVVTNRRH